MARLPQTDRLTLTAAIRRYFDVALFLLIFTGFGTLASTGRLDAVTVLVVTAALLFRGYILARRRQVLLSERWTNVLTIACVGFFVIDELIVSRGFLESLVHLVLFVMLVRLFSAQRDRDHYFLVALSFGMVLAAAVLTVDRTFLMALAGLVVLPREDMYKGGVRMCAALSASCRMRSWPWHRFCCSLYSRSARSFSLF